MPDGSQVSPILELKQQNGELVGKTSFRQGTEASITNLTVKGAEISFEVVREREGQVVLTRYEGVWSGDKITGKIASNWTGQEQTYDWQARRLIDANGVWKWSSTFGGFRSDSRLTIKQEGDRLTGKLSGGRSGDLDIKHGRFRNGQVTFQTERERDGETYTNRYQGKLTGNKIVGKMELNFFGQPRTNDWEALRTD